MPINPETLLALPQCNDPRINEAWHDYFTYASNHASLRFLRQCGRCDSFNISVHWANDLETEFAIVCLDCKYNVIWPIDRAYWAWRTFVHPQKRMLNWRIEDDGQIVYFEVERSTMEK